MYRYNDNSALMRLGNYLSVALLLSVFTHPFIGFDLWGYNVSLYTLILPFFILFNLHGLKNLSSSIFQRIDVQAMSLLSVLVVVSLILGRYDQITEIFKFILGLFVFFLIAFVIEIPLYIRAIMRKGFVFINIFLLITGFVVFCISGEYSFNFSRFTDLPYIGTKNSDALLLLILLGISFNSRDIRSNWNRILEYLTFAAIILTGSRGMTLSAIVLFIFYIVLNKNILKNIIRDVVFFLALSITGFFLLKNYIPQYYARYNKIIESPRVDILKDAVKTFIENPIVGIGVGKYSTIVFTEEADAHNYYLSMGIELGIIGLICSIFLFIPIERDYVIYSLIFAGYFFSFGKILFFWIILGYSKFEKFQVAKFGNYVGRESKNLVKLQK